MKFTTVAVIATSIAVASCQGIGDIPACAQTCLLDGIQATGCGLTDFKCTCTNQQFISSSTACIQKACSADDVVKAAKATYDLCKSVGVEIPTSGPTQAPSTTPAAPTSEQAPPTTSSAAEAPSTTSAAGTPSSYAAPSSYAVSSSSVEVSTKTATTTLCTTTSAPAGNGTVPTTVAPTAPAYTGAAAQVAGSMALALGGAVAAFFL